MMSSLASLSFTKKYVFALSLIAMLSILAYINLSTLINSQSHDGQIINVSGKQRMLSQKIALYAINYKSKKLQETVSLMNKSHNYLLSLEMSYNLKRVYFHKPMMLDEGVRKYIKSAKNFLKNRDGRSLTYILENSQSLLKNLDAAVSIYQLEAEQKIQKLQKNEFYIVMLTLFTLLLEALFIFRPANNSVKMKTKELKSQKEYADMITQINTNAIIAVDNDLMILTFNKSAEDMFGYSAEEMLHTKLIDERIIPMKFLQRHNDGLKSFMQTGELKHKDIVFELEGQHKDGTLFPIRISFGVKIEDDNKIVVANIQNITKEKEKDTLIMEQSRFAAMGEMIGNIAHQWRQPLSSISTIATGAKLRYKNNLISDEELDETFVKIKDHTQHLSKTIDDFRDFLKQDRVKELFDINEVINKSIILTEAVFKENNINIMFNHLEENVLLDGSSSELSQVFLNILNNAKDILVEKALKDRYVVINIVKESDFIIVKIQDNAGGISDEIREKVFDPYFTTKHKSQGTGIGLFMSKKIITQHFNGVIEVKNRDFDLEGNHFYGAEFSVKIKYVT